MPRDEHKTTAADADAFLAAEGFLPEERRMVLNSPCGCQWVVSLAFPHAEAHLALDCCLRRSAPDRVVDGGVRDGW